MGRYIPYGVTRPWSSDRRPCREKCFGCRRACEAAAYTRDHRALHGRRAGGNAWWVASALPTAVPKAAGALATHSGRPLCRLCRPKADKTLTLPQPGSPMTARRRFISMPEAKEALALLRGYDVDIATSTVDIRGDGISVTPPAGASRNAYDESKARKKR